MVLGDVTEVDSEWDILSAVGVDETVPHWRWKRGDDVLGVEDSECVGIGGLKETDKLVVPAPWSSECVRIDVDTGTGCATAKVHRADGRQCPSETMSSDEEGVGGAAFLLEGLPQQSLNARVDTVESSVYENVFVGDVVRELVRLHLGVVKIIDPLIKEDGSGESDDHGSQTRGVEHVRIHSLLRSVEMIGTDNNILPVKPGRGRRGTEITAVTQRDVLRSVHEELCEVVLIDSGSDGWEGPGVLHVLGCVTGCFQ